MPTGIRPTQNKVRKALFDILGDIEGKSFLELFAGSGAVGFEAVSQGAKELVLVEQERACLLALRSNIESLGLENCELFSRRADEAVRAFSQVKRRFDLIFLDPPYHKIAHYRLKDGGGYESITKKTLQILEAYDILAPNGLIIAQHFKKDILPDKLGVLSLFRQSHYGDTLLSFFKKG